MARLSNIREQTTCINDRLFGEQIKLAFLINGVIDKTREPKQIQGILVVGEKVPKNADGGTTGNWHVPIASVGSRLIINRSTYPQLIIRNGDKVQAISREGKPWFHVTSVNDRARQRLIVYLAEA